MTSLIYNTGTVTVSFGSAAVTGSLTGWAVALVAGGLLSVGGVTVPILSVESDTELTLAYEWPGSNGSGEAYAIARQPSEATARAATWTVDRLAKLAQTPWGVGVIPDGRGTLAERDAVTPLPNDDYCWLRVEVDEPAELYFRDGGVWVGPYELRGEVGPAGVGEGGYGLPADGATGQVPVKASATSGDFEWADPAGAVDSVNGKTGVVVLNADDIGDGSTNKAYTAAEQSKLSGIEMGAQVNPLVREVLTANRTYYVRTDGNDSNTGLANTSGGALLTVQRAIDVATTIDLAGYAITIQVADGTYTGAVSCKLLIGGRASIVGNNSNPANVLFNVSGTCILNNAAGVWAVSGVKLQATGAGLTAQNGGTLTFSNMDFGTCTYYQIQVSTGGNIQATGNYTISGGAQNHIAGFMNGNFQCQSRTVTITGTPGFSSAFLFADTSSAAIVNGNTYSGAATGKRYNATLGAAINTNGGGATYLPGDSSGTATTGYYA